MTEPRDAGYDHAVPVDLLDLWMAVEAKLPPRLSVPHSLGAGLDWFVTRDQWGARAPRPGILGITPVFGLTIHYEGSPGAADHANCASLVRGIQAYHMDAHGWLDIAYSWLGCRHGYVFEGRGPHQRTAANGSDSGNSAALAHCLLIGDGDVPNDTMIRLAAGMAKVARVNGAGPKINGHRDWISTSCPGDPTYAALPAIRSYADQPDPAPPVPAPTPPQEDDLMRDERLIVIPDVKEGKQLVSYDKDGHYFGHDSLTSSVQVKAAADGTFTPLIIQPTGYADALVLSIAKLDGSPAPAGHQARIVIEHR